MWAHRAQVTTEANIVFARLFLVSPRLGNRALAACKTLASKRDFTHVRRGSHPTAQFTCPTNGTQRCKSSANACGARNAKRRLTASAAPSPRQCGRHQRYRRRPREPSGGRPSSRSRSRPGWASRSSRPLHHSRRRHVHAHSQRRCLRRKRSRRGKTPQSRPLPSRSSTAATTPTRRRRGRRASPTCARARSARPAPRVRGTLDVRRQRHRRVAHPDRRTRGGRHRRAPFQHQARGRTSPRIPGRRSVLIRRPSPLRRVDAIGATVVPSMNEALHTSEPSPRCGAQARGPPARGPRGEGAPSRRCVVEPPPTRRFIDAAASGATVSTRSMPSAARSPAADDLSR